MTQTKTIKRQDIPPPKPEIVDEDLRRLCMSLITLFRKRYPNDFRQMLAKLGGQVKAE